VPRQRTARTPLLSTSAPRSDGTRTRGGGPFRARVVAVGLVLVSVALLTVYFRESSGGPLHGAQRIAVSVLTPFEVAAERVARPFRDAYGWTADLFAAKDENAELEAEVEDLRRRLIENEAAVQENERLRALLDFRGGPKFPSDFDAVTTRIIVQPQSVFRQEVTVAAGSSDGIKVDDPVITDDGLVGTVTDVTGDAAHIRLLTDGQSAASAYVLETGADGIVLHGKSESALEFGRVQKTDEVEKGHIVVTSGAKVGEFESLFPRGIPVCVVTSVSQLDIDPFKRIQCAPLVDFDSLDEVIVLTEKKKKRASP
jgi:rod shape-determining protein MreC